MKNFAQTLALAILAAQQARALCVPGTDSAGDEFDWCNDADSADIVAAVETAVEGTA